MLIAGKTDIGLQFPGLFRWPFLYKDITLASFHSLGKEDRVIAWLKINVNESEIAGATILIILQKILSMPVALLLKSPCKRRQTWLTVTGWNAANSDSALLVYNYFN